MAMWKALIPGILLTWIVAGVIGSNGSKGGVLTIHYLSLTGNGAFTVPQNGIYWSWPLFVCATLLGFAIFKMME